MAGSRYRPSTPIRPITASTPASTPATRSHSPVPSSGTLSPTLPVALRSDLTIASPYLILTPPASSTPDHILENNPADRIPPSPRAILDEMTKFLRPRTPHPPQLEIAHVSSTTFNDFLTRYAESPLLNHTKLDYDAPNHRIILCAPPTPYHDCMPSFLQETLTSLRGTPFDTAPRQRTLRVTQVSWRAPNGSYLVPDAAISVMGPQPRVWPSLVVEVANTQTYESATAKVARWFTMSEGGVEVALLMKFTAQDAMVDPACFLEVWRSRRGRAAVESTSVDVPAALVPVEHDGSSPLVFSSDEEADPAPPTDENLDAAYGSALPEASIYRDGPRRTVHPMLPGAQAPITLRYSDFFGRENVPPGRDPDEVVLLQLDVLHEVLMEFVDLTRAQVASIKRRREDEGEGEEVTPVVEEEVDPQGGRGGGKRVRR